MEYEDQLKAGGLIWGTTGPSLIVLTAFQTKDKGHWPAHRGLSSPLNANTREP